MRVTAPAPVTFLPESLFSLFSRPGRELTVRVIQVESKTLTLETGGEKFQARIAGSLLPDDFRPGETIRVRVLSSGPPVLLHIVEGEKISEAEARLLQIFQSVQAELPSLVSRFPTISERPELYPLVSFFVKLLEAEEKKFVEGPERNRSQDIRAKDKRGSSSKAVAFEEGELRIASQLIHDKGLLLPFAFADRTSWGFLEAGEETKATAQGKRYFYLHLFLSELGLVEAFLGLYSSSKLDLHFYFSREEALELAREQLFELKKDLAERGFYVEVTLERSHYEPGVILAREG